MRRLINWALRLALLALVLLAVLMTALRLALPVVADRYRVELTAALSQRLQHPLRVEALSLRLVGWSPQLLMDNLTISSPHTGTDLLRLRALRADLDPIASLRAGQPRLGSLTLVGAQLAVRRTREGLSLVGLATPGPAEPDALAPFLSEGQLRLTDGDLLFIDDTLGGAVLRLTRLSLRLHNAGRLHQFELAASLAPGTAQGRAPIPVEARLQVLADLQGAAGDPRRWDGEVYLNLVGADLAALMPRGLPGPELVSTQGVSLESWNRMERGDLRESLNRVGMRGLVLRLPDGPAPEGAADADPQADASGAAAGTAVAVPSAVMALDHLDGLVRLTPADSGWRVQTAQLGLALDGLALADLGLDLGLDARWRPRALDLAVTNLDLQLVARSLGAWPPSLALPWPLDPHLIAALDPRGRLGYLAVRIRLTPQGSPSWQAAAQVQGLGLTRHGQFPGLTGLDARVRATQDGGMIGLDAAGVGLDLRPLFEAPLQFARCGGALTWQRGPTDGWQFASTDLVLGNADLSGRARFTLDLPGPVDAGNSGPFLDLRASIQDLDLAKLGRYLPVGLMHPQTTERITRSLVSGTLPRGDLVLRGPLQRFPFKAREGLFELSLDYRDLVLRYLPGWPPIEAAAGGLRLADQGLEVRLDQGHIYQTELRQGRTLIPDLWKARRLPLHVEASGPFADDLKFIRDTPLAGRLGSLARSLEVEGRSQIVLDLDIPLDAAGALRVDGRLSWPQPAGLGLKGTPVQLTGLVGDLRFGVDSLRADPVRARLWGRPVTLAIVTAKPATGSSPTTRIRARSRTPVAVLAEQFPSPLWSLASGDLDWDLALDLRHADLGGPGLALRWQLRSDLRGLALDLPQPLGKAGAASRPLELTGALVPDQSLSTTGRVAPLAWDLVLDLTGAQPRLGRGRVTLGKTGAAPPTAPGLAIDGALGELNLPVWYAWWERLATHLGTGPSPPANVGALLGAVSTDLHLRRLDLGWISLTDALVQADTAAAGWDLSVVSRQLAGQVRLPGGWADQPRGFAPVTPLVVNLERLDLKALLPAGGKTLASPAPAEPMASGPHLPALDLRVSDLRWGEDRFGRLDLEVRPTITGVEVQRIEFEGLGNTRLTGKADSQVSSSVEDSRVALDLRSADTGPLLRALGYAPLLGPAQVDAHLRLRWAGGLGAFALAQSRGQIALDVGPGRLLDVNVEAGRVLGFLNGIVDLYDLRRRLSLDLADFYAKGFGFERITGRIDLGCGQARLARFEIQAPSSDIRVSGLANLRTRTYDQLVTVVPGIGTSLALLSGAAGGPELGVGVYLFNRLTGGAINRLASFQYRITGPWDKPLITRLGWEPFAGGQGGNPSW